MSGQSKQKRLRVVVVGGGVGGLEAILALRHWAGERVSVALLADQPVFRYRALSVQSPFGTGGERRYPLQPLVSKHGAELVAGRLASVDPGERIAWTEAGDSLPYDALVVALGAVGREALPGAISFGGRRADADAVRAVLDAAAAGEVRRLAFAVPTGSHWALPLYELALMSAASLRERGVDADLQLVTPEQRPLMLFGRCPSEEVEHLLSERGIELHPGTHPRAVGHGILHTLPELRIPADRVISLPRLVGPGLAGLPRNTEGFVTTDPSGQVQGVEGVWAVGDCSSFPVKHGSIAAQQGDAAAQAIAVRAGALDRAGPFRPVVRGLLLTGDGPAYMRAAVHWDGGAAERDNRPLWWPPEKLAGRFLGPELAALAVTSDGETAFGAGAEAFRIDVELPTELEDLHPDRLLA